MKQFKYQSEIQPHYQEHRNMQHFNTQWTHRRQQSPDPGGRPMKTIRVEKTLIDLKTGQRKELFAEVQSERDEKHPIYTLTYEGYQTEWQEVTPC
jgi:hypothetical protein